MLSSAFAPPKGQVWPPFYIFTFLPYLVHAAHVVQEVVLFGVVYGGGRLCEQAQHGLHLLLSVLPLGDLQYVVAKWYKQQTKSDKQ